MHQKGSDPATGGTRRGALLGGAIGILGGPIGKPGSSAAVIEISQDAAPQAEQVLKVLNASQIVTEAIDASVDALFAGEAAPASETEIASAAHRA